MSKTARKAAALPVQDATLQETVPATAPTADAPAQDVQAQPAPAQLTIADLQLLAQAIDIASSRGAYRANEMGDVGGVYNRLTAFLTAIAKQRQEAGK